MPQVGQPDQPSMATDALAQQACEARYRTLFEYTQVGILLADADSVYLDANPCICQMLGYTRDELVGKHASDIVAPAEVGHIGTALDEIHGRADHRREWRFRRKDGSTFPAEVVATKLPDGTLLGLVRDLSERQRIHEYREHLAAIVESSSDAIIGKDLHGTITGWNAGAQALFGYTASEMIGTPIARLIPDDRQDEERTILDSLRQGRRVELLETRRRARDGRLIEVSLTAAPMRDSSGAISGAAVVARDITALKRHEREVAYTRDEAERILRDQQRFTDTMIESMPGAVYFYDAAGHFLRWNRNFETVTGYSAAEIAGMHPREFFPVEERARLEARIAEVFTRGESSIEAPFRAKDGSTTPYYFTGRRVDFAGGPCLVGVGIDISQRRLAEDRLAESERQYRELVEHANSIILRWNSEGRITFLNAYGLRFFGYAPSGILGRHVMETLVPPTESGGRDLRRLMDDICADPEAFEQSINENMRSNGDRVWVAWTNRIVRDAQGRVQEILSIGTDITARRQAEAERERLHRAEEADRIKSAFLATMSHELRTPLNSIIGFTGIMLQGLAGPLNPEQHRQLDMVRGSARHLLALVNDVLDISKIEAGQFEIAHERFDPQVSIAKVVDLIRPQAAAKGLELRFPAPPLLGEMHSDERRFRQILLNLLSNAIKFTDHGWVGLDAEAIAGPAIRLRVSDSGPGIRPEDLPSLFQPFRQIDGGLSRNHDGTGLGLAICRRLSELMGGGINADSTWGTGSTFTVTLPMRAPESR